jgi:hypothetical protein
MFRLHKAAIIRLYLSANVKKENYTAVATQMTKKKSPCYLFEAGTVQLA